MQNNESWQALTEFACHLADAAAAAILPLFRKNTPIDVKVHETWDPVTEGDRAGERAIRQLIEDQYPDHGIIGEEYGNKPAKSDFTWVLDPVDGTRAFVIGLPTWATLIGLYEKGHPRVGVMNQPFVGDMFYGSPAGSWLNHRGQIEKLQVRSTTTLADAALGTTSPHLYKGIEARNFETLRNNTKVARYGGDAYFFSLLAAGHLDIAMDAGLQIYDIAALIPIIRGAGGIVECWDDRDVSQGGNVLAAATPALFSAAKNIMTAKV
jgi:myo-inositol-1(or 4)-monophosphatase